MYTPHINVLDKAPSHWVKIPSQISNGVFVHGTSEQNTVTYAEEHPPYIHFLCYFSGYFSAGDQIS